jgi:uncharacterized membrane protein
MGSLIWKLKRAMGTLWLRAALFGIVAVFTALIGYYFKGIIPEDFTRKIGAEAVDGILNIIASTMLAVTTFSMSTMVAAYSAATNNVTPRSTSLLLKDTVSQTVLSTFLGAFIFSLVGIIALRMGIYGDGGRIILFAVTIVVLFLLVATLIRWIEYLSKLGRMGETISLVEKAAIDSIQERLARPYLGGERLDFEIPKTAKLVFANECGYVQYVDVAALSSIADKHDGAKIYLKALPGSYIHTHKALVYIDGMDVDEVADKIRGAFISHDDRTFEQDPRFGVIVMAEISSRALSAAINDSGTAIDSIWTTMRILRYWAEVTPEQRMAVETEFPNVYVPPIKDEDLVDDAFAVVARDGGNLREVMIALQKALGALAAYENPEFRRAVVTMSDKALKYAEQKMLLKEEYDEVAAVAASWRTL